MEYILIEVAGIGSAYQEVFRGNVVRYTDLGGATLDITGRSSQVVDATPATPAWAVPDPEPVPAPAYTPPVREFTKLEWRRRFASTEQKAIDRFNATFENHPALDDDQKDDIRTGLANYAAASVVNADDPDVPAVLGLYTLLGFLAEGRAQEILNA